MSKMVDSSAFFGTGGGRVVPKKLKKYNRYRQEFAQIFDVDSTGVVSVNQ